MNTDDLDREVRKALEPDAGAVDRVVREALNEDRHHRPAYGRRLAIAGAAAVFLVGVLLLGRDPRVRTPDITRMTNIDDTIVVTPPAGGVWLIGGDGKDEDRLPAGTIVVYRSGESR